MSITQENVMTVANVSQGSAHGLPHALRAAQDAIKRPDVQDMLRKLSEYNLGIFMPHMHDEHSGDFQPLADDAVQVEAGLRVSFHRTEKLALETDRYLPVGWRWRAGAAATVAACEMASDEGDGPALGSVKHKMGSGH